MYKFEVQGLKMGELAGALARLRLQPITPRQVVLSGQLQVTEAVTSATRASEAGAGGAPSRHLRRVRYLARGTYGCILQDLDAPHPSALKLYYGDARIARASAASEQNIAEIVRGMDRDSAFSIVPMPPTDVDVDDLDPSLDVMLCDFGKDIRLHRPIVPSAVMALGGETMGDARGRDWIPMPTTAAMTVHEFARALGPLLQGLVRFAERSFSHNDIKPDNIVHTSDGFKFIDFGISGDAVKFRTFFEQYGHLKRPFHAPELACIRKDADCPTLVEAKLNALYTTSLQPLVDASSVFDTKSREWATWKAIGSRYLPQTAAGQARLPRALLEVMSSRSLSIEELMSFADVFSLGASLLYMLRAMAPTWVAQDPELYASLVDLAAGMTAPVIGRGLVEDGLRLTDRSSAAFVFESYKRMGFA